MTNRTLKGAVKPSIKNPTWSYEEAEENTEKGKASSGESRDGEMKTRVLNSRRKEVTVVSDFESGFYQPLMKMFAGVKWGGCLFHYSQAIMKKVRSNGVLSDMYRMGIRKNIKKVDVHRVYVCIRRLTVVHHISMKYITRELVEFIINQVRNIQSVKNKNTNTLEYIDILSILNH